MISPNQDERRFGPPDMVVLHYTEMTLAGALARLCDPAARVSAHWVIAADGALHALVPEERRAWHAGVSHWEGVTDINSRAVGIELDSPGHAPQAPDFPEPQIAALLRLLDGIRTRWPVPVRGVVAHSDVAPGRKIDPGERFPWSRLAAAGHALALPAVPDDPAPADADALTDALRGGGYGVAPDADAAPLATVVRAFHRRHRPDLVELPADRATVTAARGFAALVAADRAGGDYPGTRHSPMSATISSHRALLRNG